jgi:acetate---CoA ligase (ADP-forming)
MATTAEERIACLKKILSPSSIAVVGATKVPGTVPYDIFYNILKDNFQGVIYPVSPSTKAIGGVKAYKYVLDIPDPVDLAVIVFQSSVVHMALDQCGQKGTKGVIVISAGFREIGAVGVERERQLKEIADKYGISFIGPNCLGVINTDPATHLNASFARKMPQEGSIGFLSQSGALCTAVLDYAQAKRIGFSKFISFGNKADISEIDLMYYLRDDPKTKVILVYLEEVTDGRAFMEAARDIIRNAGKPVLAIKSGRTREGAAAAASHTGSLAGSDEITEAAMRQAGVIRCTTIEEMFNVAIALAYQPLPRGNRVAIITNAGGPGVLATDAAITNNLMLAQFAESTRETFKKALPATANTKNPVDVIGDARADRYRVAMTGALQDPGVDGTFVILTPQSMTDIENIAAEVTSVAARQDKPVYASFMGEADVAPGISILQSRNIPHYILPESMSRAYAGALFFKRHRDAAAETLFAFTDLDPAKAKAILDSAVAAGRRYLREEEAVGILEAFGLPVLPFGIATSAQEASRMAEQIGFPVAMKVSSEQIVHKSDIGGVVIDVRDGDAAATGFTRILENVARAQPEAVVRGVYLQKMAKPGEEVILGVKRDPSFGPVIMFGLGGIFVEIFKDVVLRVAPVGPATAAEMVREIHAFRLLAGARGKNRRDIAAIEECIQRLSVLAMLCPEIAELDINPLIVSDEGAGAHVADARVLLQ